MFTIKYPFCNSPKVTKNGIRKEAQFYRCKCCNKQFTAIRNRLSVNAIWYDYLEGKQTISEIAQLRNISESTVKRYLPYLFTFQSAECGEMPNTNNKTERTFTDLKKNLNNHSGLTKEHRQQFIIAYFQNRQNMQPNYP